MLKKIKNKICELICKAFSITICVCNHNCGCKEKARKK